MGKSQEEFLTGKRYSSEEQTQLKNQVQASGQSGSQGGAAGATPDGVLHRSFTAIGHTFVGGHVL